MCGLPDSEKFLKMCTNVTDRQTPHDSIGRTCAQHHAAKITAVVEVLLSSLYRKSKWYECGALHIIYTMKYVTKQYK